MNILEKRKIKKINKRINEVKQLIRDLNCHLPYTDKEIQEIMDRNINKLNNKLTRRKKNV